MMSEVVWIDNHCHLPDDPDQALEQVEHAARAGVLLLVDVGTDIDHSRAAITRAERFQSVVATAGVHPHDAKDGIDGLAELLEHPRVVAVGECGLDYHYDNSPRDVQRRVFAQQIELAHEHQLPLVIHSRSAWEDTFEMLDVHGIPANTVFHCFTGGPAEAEWALERGVTLSFSGIVTFPSATDLAEAAKMCPLGSMMVETDSPYLAPVPHRGRKNRPELVVAVGQKIAALKQVDVERVARATSLNAIDFYGLREPFARASSAT